MEPASSDDRESSRASSFPGLTLIRRQLPAYSPLHLGGLARAALARPREAEAVLEALIRDRYAGGDVVLCGSGTQALQLAITVACDRSLHSAGRVALPAFTCFDVASAAIGANVDVVFYDIDPASLVPDMESLEHALELDPAAVVVAPLYGYQPDWKTLRALVRRRDVTLIEDAAQSFGSLWEGRPAGAQGDLSVLSFGRGKGWTGGEGGALLGPTAALVPPAARPPPSARLSDRVRILGKGLAQWALGRPALYGIPTLLPWLRLGETVYHPPVHPRALSPAAARLAVETLQASEVEASHRRSRARVLAEQLANVPGLSIPAPDPRSEPGFIRVPILASPDERARILRAGRTLGVMPSYPIPLPSLPPLLPHARDHSPRPGAEELARSLFTVPTHSLLNRNDRTRLLTVLRAQAP